MNRATKIIEQPALTVDLLKANGVGSCPSNEEKQHEITLTSYSLSVRERGKGDVMHKLF